MPSTIDITSQTACSTLVLGDRLLTLAGDASRAGLHRPAERLLRLAYALYDEKPGHDGTLAHA